MLDFSVILNTMPHTHIKAGDESMMERIITFENEALYFIDQTRLPSEYIVERYTDYKEVCRAIKILKVRGAPAIGVAAGYAVVVASYQFDDKSVEEHKKNLSHAINELSQTRPTAVNLFWALNKMKKVIEEYSENNVAKLRQNLLDEANAIADEDYELGYKLGEVGSEIIENGNTVMTICNAGSLATSGIGSALSCLHVAKEKGKSIKAIALETRPLLQGARLTAWELNRNEIPVTLITDSMAAMVLKQGKVDLIIVGADRIAANGDSANKIGTYSLSVLADYHKIPFYVAAPFSTFDMSLENGELIPIEERGEDELKYFNGKQIAPLEISVYNPAFDVAPAQNITGIITEKGIIKPPYTENIKKVLG